MVLVLAVGRVALAAEAGRVQFNDGWTFHLGDTPEAGDVPLSRVRQWLDGAGNTSVRVMPDATPTTRPDGAPPTGWSFAAAGFDDSGWRTLSLPHDWAIEGPFRQELNGETGKRPFAGVAWYRKAFTLDAADAGRPVFLDFDGAMSHATVWINGQFAGGWPYGYTSFRVDATKFAVAGRNTVAVRLQNPPDSSRWYPGAGIYRGVWLVKSSPVHVDHWGVRVTTPQITDAAANVRTSVTVRNDTDASVQAQLRIDLMVADAEGRAAGTPVATASVSTTIDAHATARPTAMLKIDRPRQWSAETPSRYVARIRVERDGQTVDQYDQVFGVRTVEFTADKGMLLNGKPLPLQGVCDHHDLGALGTAFNTRAMQRKLEILKSFGVNALRTSHNPPAPEVLELCDRMGIVVLDESFDCWRAGKLPNDYHGLFDAWHERDLRALVRRDANHPSVIAWSVGNEVLEQGGPRGSTTRPGYVIGEQLRGIVRDEDPTRVITSGFNHGSSGFDGLNRTVDVMGFNYKPQLYKRFHAETPDQPYMSTESASVISSRGEYFFPVTDKKNQGRSSFQMSSYDLYAPSWATTADDEFLGQTSSSAAGEFVWTGFDYIGEPTPYNRDVTNLLNFTDPAERTRAEAELKELGKIRVPSRSSYFGIVDLAGFPKDRFYLYQSKWRPDLPIAHILPHWNWPERVGQVTPVHVYTSGDAAELFLNGRSLGRREKTPGTFRLRWDDVTYEPGELKVVAYKAGKPWAEDVRQTTGPAARLGLSPDRPAITGDGVDLAYLTLTVTDDAGRTVPRVSPRVRFTVDGPGEIVATDNGNAIDHESFQSSERNAYNGLALVIVRAKRGASGVITVKAAAEGLKDVTATVQATNR